MTPTPSHDPFAHLRDTLAALPDAPGCYQMQDAQGRLLYVGKAKNLKHRVRSYFAKSRQHTARIEAMVQQVDRIQTTTTDSETEALLLEANLIATHQPRYNVLLRHEKRYPWLGLSNGPFPRLFVTRTPVKGTAQAFFGPYLNGQELFELIKLIRQHFPLRQRRFPLFKDRPCMNYHLGLCPGPCQDLISTQGYQEIVHQLSQFLRGKTQELSEELRQEMATAAESLNFERAAKLRDRLVLVEKITERQKIVSPDPTRRLDVLGVASAEGRAVVCRLVVRKGRLIASQPFVLSTPHEDPGEILKGALVQVYQQLPTDELPPEVVVRHLPPDAEQLGAVLGQWRGRSVRLIHAQRGEREELLTMAERNATRWLEDNLLDVAQTQQNDPVQALMALQDILKLPDYLERMECYDISHFQGAQTVASMVTFTDGAPDRAAYRRFKIQCAEGSPDDFASMREVIARRMDHLNDWGEPSLLIIDGGKGQLSAAQESLQRAGMGHIPMISLAKRLEEVFLPGQSVPIHIPHDHPALFLLQRIRDEAHRFAVSYHRTLRERNATKSSLDSIPGIGEVRRKKLYAHFKTVQKMKQASVADIAQVLNLSPAKAEAIYDHLQALPM